MVIMAVAFMAVFKALNTSVSSEEDVELRTIAHLVAEQAQSAIRAGVVDVVGVDKTRDFETRMLGHKWRWRVALLPTENPYVWKTLINVYLSSSGVEYAHTTGFVTKEAAYVS